MVTLIIGFALMTTATVFYHIHLKLIPVLIDSGLRIQAAINFPVARRK
jgi:hypothetical protein